MKKIILGAVLLTLCNCAYSQSITFDYSNPGFSSSCNIFAVTTTPATPISYQGYEHTTSFGFPYYSSSEKAIVLETKPISFTQDGVTQFAIKYAFKKDYTYTISVNFKGILGAGAVFFPEVAVAWGDNNAGLNNSTTCTGTATKDPVFHTTIYGHGVGGSSYVQSPNIWNGIATQAHSYLWIAATPSAGAWNNYSGIISKILIKNIIITETPPAPPAATFTITPANLTYQCGSVIPQNFTVNNASNTTGVSSYTWNLGSPDNGWLYANSPAPQIIITNTNTITLIPICDKVQTNITASVTANGNNYPTNTSVVSVTKPRLVGGNNLCTNSQPYFVLDLPCNASVSSWSSSNTAIATISNTGILTKLGNGLITITANLTSSSSGTLCGPTILTRQVIVGVPYASEFQLRMVSAPASVCLGRPERYEITCDNTWLAQNQLLNFSWQWPTGWQALSQGRTSTGSYLDVNPNGNTNTPANMILRISTACGPIPPQIIYARVLTYRTDCYNFRNFQICPNPASSEITISALGNKENKIALKNIKEIKISDNLGILKSTRKFNGKNKSEKVFVNTLPIGQYQVSILTDDGWETIPLSILK